MPYLKKLLLLSLLFLFLLPFSVSAITISPLKLDISLSPGQTQQYEVTLFNETKDPVYLTGTLEAVTPQGERGEASVAKPDKSNEAVSWIKVPVNSFELKPGQIAHVPLIVNIPSTAPVGGYYLASMWQTSFSPKKDQSQIGVSSRVGAILLIRVKGEAKEQLSVLDFKISNSRNFFDHKNADFLSRLENQGNVHVAPSGQLVIKNMFGRVSASIPFNSAKGNILPRSIRQFGSSWGSPGKAGFFQGFLNEWQNFGLGQYTARLDLEYGDSRQRLQSQAISWWIIPWRTMILAVIVILIIIFLTRRRKAKG